MNLDDIEAEEQAELERQRAANKRKKRLWFHRKEKEKPDILPEDEYKGTDLKGFFIKLRRYKLQILYINLIMLVVNFPVIFAVIGLSGLFKNDFMIPSSNLFAVMQGTFYSTGAVSPSSLIYFGLNGIMTESSAFTAMSYVMFGLSALTFLTFGIANVGTTYLMRNMIRGEHVFVIDDFKYAVKKNWKQGLIMGIIDLALLLLIPYNILYFRSNAQSFMFSVLYYLMIIFSIIYLVMRFYIYLQMVTFDLSIFKILKNSLIFVVLGIKRNLLAIIGVLLIAFLCWFVIFGFYGILISVGIVFILVYAYALGAFMCCYAAYYKMKEVMIDPYYDEDGNPYSEDETENSKGSESEEQP